MTGKTFRHLGHYIILLIILLTGLIGMIISGKSTLIHTTILVLISIGYFVWGIVHHFLEKELHPEIIFEYLLMSLLGLATVLGVLYYL